jgi:hypothetical protein
VVEFWLCANLLDKEGLTQAQLYKKMNWPVLPRVDEWVDNGTYSGVAVPVESVWHWWNHEPPRTDVMIEVYEHDFERLRKDPDWVKDPDN